MHRLNRGEKKIESHVMMKKKFELMITIQMDESCELRQKSWSKANLMLILINLRWKSIMNEKGRSDCFEYGS